MSDYKGEHYCFTTVDGFEVTETRSGRDSHGSQAIWTYFNGHLIANSDARQLEAELRCYPHKFVHSKDASSEHRFICSVCGRKTSDFDEYYSAQGHFEGRYNYPATNITDLPENKGRVFDSIAFLESL